MKRLNSLVLFAVILFMAFTGCTGESETQVKTYEGKNVYIDEATELHFDYKRCYSNAENLEDPAEESNLSGVVDSKGEIVIPPKYESAVPAGKNLFVVAEEKDGKTVSALIDKSGKEIVPFTDGQIVAVYGENYSDSKIVFVKPVNEKEYVVDTSGKVIINPGEYEELYITPNAELEGIKDGTLFIFDRNGNIKEKIGAEPIAYGEATESGLQLVVNFVDGKTNYGVVNAEKAAVVSPEYDRITIIDENRIIARKGSDDSVEEDNIIVFFDGEGKVVCPAGVYNNAYFRKTESGYSQSGTGLTVAGEKITKWVIDQNGNKLSQAYDEIIRKDDGTFTARSGDKTFTLDSNGKVI